MSQPFPYSFPKIMWAVLSPFPSKREGDGSLFCALTRRKFFWRLSMISWGQFYVTEMFCDFLLRHNLLIKLQPWLTFLWTTFCPCFNLKPKYTLNWTVFEVWADGRFKFVDDKDIILKINISYNMKISHNVKCDWILIGWYSQNNNHLIMIFQTYPKPRVCFLWF